MDVGILFLELSHTNKKKVSMITKNSQKTIQKTKLFVFFNLENKKALSFKVPTFFLLKHNISAPYGVYIKLKY